MNHRLTVPPEPTSRAIRRPGPAHPPKPNGVSGSAETTYFQQPCPTCGRRLLIGVQYLGAPVRCGHCHGRFVARDPAGTPPDAAAGNGQCGDGVLQRANRLLALCAELHGAGRARWRGVTNARDI